MPRETKAEREEREKRERLELEKLAKETAAYLREVGLNVDFSFSKTSPPSKDMGELITMYFDNAFDDCSSQIADFIEADYGPFHGESSVDESSAVD